MRVGTVRTNLLAGVVHTLDNLASQPALRNVAHSTPAATPHLVTGRAGELAAFFCLRRQGYTVVARDWKSPRAPGDIDLIAWEDDTLCFVEVKTRTSRDFATAEAAVDEHKRRTLRKLAGYYVRNLPEGIESRFDVLSIYLSGEADQKEDRAAEFQLFRGAFDWMERE